MQPFIKACRIISLSVIGLLLANRAALQSLVGQEQPPAGIAFHVVSVRVLSDKEATQRSGDFIGPDVAVRLRLSCTDRGFYFYALKGAAIPLGYTVKMTDKGPLWLAGRSGKEPISPGIQQLTFGMPGSWNLLPAGARPAIEWEELDSTSLAGEKHARTAFIKRAEQETPIEIMSDSYAVPSKPDPHQAEPK